VRPLDGITVVSIEQAVAAPFATRQLADLGARVIKIERPDGGDFARDYDATVRGLSAYFVWLNRSKESLTLDLKQPEAMAVLHALLDRADVFVQNLAPGAAARLGLAAATVRAHRPRLVVADVSGYGADGPYRDKKAYDLLVQCETGVVSVTGTPEAPAKAGISIADIAGGMYTYSAVLSALLLRGRTGVGTACEVSLFDAMSEWMGHPLNTVMYTGVAPARTGTSHPSIAPYGSFRVGATATVQLGVQNEREWRRFCESVLESADVATDPRYATNPRRVEHRDELTALIESVFRVLTIDEVVARLDAAGIANARLRDVAGLLAHPQLAARGRWSEVESPVGPLPTLLPPVIIEGVAPRLDRIPALGEHTDAVLAELGYNRPEVDALRAAGAV
jgi:itaconate CoA-transferase